MTPCAVPQETNELFALEGIHNFACIQLRLIRTSHSVQHLRPYWISKRYVFEAFATAAWKVAWHDLVNTKWFACMPILVRSTFWLNWENLLPSNFHQCLHWCYLSPSAPIALIYLRQDLASGQFRTHVYLLHAEYSILEINLGKHGGKPYGEDSTY